jgi:uncharacterized membrane protein YGL010W
MEIFSDIRGGRPVERWFAAYAADHRNPINQQLHVICVPAIVWSLIALLHAVPTPAAWGDGLPSHGVVAALLTAAAIGFWLWLSVPLGFGILLLVVSGFGLSQWILDSQGAGTLLVVAAAVFVVAWIGQFIGHHLEGRRPSFFTDLVYLLIGPPWVLAKAYRKLGLPV